MFNCGGTLQAFCITAQADHSNYVSFRRMDVWHKQCIGECVRVAVISVVSFLESPEHATSVRDRPCLTGRPFQDRRAL
jgi:hypothetical protein